eukprot:6241511-Prymnesium_polylepis.1
MSQTGVRRSCASTASSSGLRLPLSSRSVAFGAPPPAAVGGWYGGKLVPGWYGGIGKGATRAELPPLLPSAAGSRATALSAAPAAFSAWSACDDGR